jgi:fatty-acyl-CoA synthase
MREVDDGMETSFPALVRGRAERDPHRRALTFDDRTWTFAELRADFEALASGLAAAGVRRGDRVVYAGANHSSLVMTMFATMDLGAVFVPINPQFAAAEREWVFNDVRPRLAVVSDQFRSDFADLGVPVMSADGVGERSVTGLIEVHEPAPRFPVARTELGLILYTSGTTGRPKGVMQTHEMLLATGTNLARVLGARRDDVGLVMSPMFHVAGLLTNPSYVWAYGGEVVLLPRMNGTAVLDAIARYGVTRIDAVTAALGILYHTPGFAQADISSVRSLLVGGAPIPVEHVTPFRDAGAEVYMAIGMTECTLAASLPFEKLVTKPASVGVSTPLTESRLVSVESGEVIDDPEVMGELCLRGPGVTIGYWNNPVATAAAVDSEGWFHTGDLARLDAEGDLFLVGRLKDVIKTGGESVAAAEVEKVVVSHPAVSVCAVIGMPDQRWGETIVAVVSTTEGSDLTLDALRDFCGPHLARFKMPTRLVVTEDFPMTASGKVAKHVLKEQLSTESVGASTR